MQDNTLFVADTAALTVVFHSVTGLTQLPKETYSEKMTFHGSYFTHL